MCRLQRLQFLCVLVTCLLAVVVPGDGLIVSTIPVSTSGLNDTTHYFQNLTFAPTGTLPGVERVAFTLTVEPLEYNSTAQTRRVRTTATVGLRISGAYSGPGLQLRVSYSRGYCRYKEPDVTLIDEPVITPLDTTQVEVSDETLICNQIYYATVALTEGTTTAIGLTEILTILHVSERNIPCVPVQIRCPNFATYAYPPIDDSDFATVTRQAWRTGPAPDNTPYFNLAEIGTWAEAQIEPADLSVFMERKIQQSESPEATLNVQIDLRWYLLPLPGFGDFYHIFSYSYNHCGIPLYGAGSGVLSPIGGGSGMLIHEFTNTCNQEIFMDLRLFNGSFLSQSRENAVIMVENFGDLYQTVSGFDDSVCVRFQLDCTPFTPLSAVANVFNHKVLVGDIIILATNFPNATTNTRLYNSAENNFPFYNPYRNANLITYNITAGIRRVALSSEISGGIAYAIDVNFDYNTTESYSPENATLTLSAYRNFCGVDESSPSFIGRIASSPLLRGVGYKDQLVNTTFELDQSMCGQNVHLQVQLESQGTSNDIWLIALTHGQFTAHGNKMTRSLCIQYYVDCDSPIVPPATIPVAPGYDGLSYMNLLGIAAIGWGSLLVVGIIIDILVGCLFGPFGGE